MYGIDVVFLLMLSMKFRSKYILNIRDIDCCCIINRDSKSKAIKSSQNTDSAKESETLKKSLEHALKLFIY